MSPGSRARLRAATCGELSDRICDRKRALELTHGRGLDEETPGNATNRKADLDHAVLAVKLYQLLRGVPASCVLITTIHWSIRVRVPGVSCQTILVERSRTHKRNYKSGCSIPAVRQRYPSAQRV